MKLDRRSTLFIGIAVIVAILIGAWALIISPGISKQNELNETLSQKKQDIEASKTKLAGLQKVKENINTYVQQNNELSSKFPGNADIKLLIGDITKAGSASKVKSITKIEAGDPKIVSASPNAPASTNSTDTTADSGAGDGATNPSANSGTTQNNLAIMPLTITAEGSQGSLKSYATQLTKMPRAFLVSQSSISCESSTNNCDLTVNGSTYLYRQTQLPQGK